MSDGVAASELARERAVIFVIAGIQFVNIWDFMMVMPLGPQFVAHLGIDASQMGMVAGSYTAAAAVSGLLTSRFLDRFDRRPALVVALLGLAFATAAGGAARDVVTLLLARVAAGAFGGPATSLALSIVADVVPLERRGRALGTIMMSFSVASVLGVPAALLLAERLGFRAPFFVVGALGLASTASALRFLPPLRKHLDEKSEPVSLGTMLARPDVLLAYAIGLATMFGMFLLVPNISNYVVFNVGYPRENLFLLYMSGGVTSILVLRVAGVLTDKIGASRVGASGTLVFIVILWIAFVNVPPAHGPWPMLIFAAFMASASLRNVPYNQISSRVPSPRERARYMSIQSVVQHLAGAVAGLVSTKALTTENEKLIGIPRLAWWSMGIAALVPVLMFVLERRLDAAKRAAVSGGS